MSGAALDYLPALIEAFEAGDASDHVHLGYWPDSAPQSGWREAQEAMTVLHLDHAALRDGMALLDVGCGIGGTLRLADGRMRNARLIGVNIDPRQLAVCRRLASAGDNRFDWVAGDAVALPFGDASFDALLCVEAMFHFASRPRFLAEAARVLRPGGRLVASDIVFRPPDPSDRRLVLALDLVRQGYAPWPDPCPGPAAVEAAGLDLREDCDLTDGIAPSWAHIAPGEDPYLPEHPVAAMRALHAAGLMRYPLRVYVRR